MSISAAWPNPASGVVQARLFLPTTNRVWASVFDVRGRHVRTIVDAPKPAGQHLLTWDGLDEDGFPAASGTYFLKLSTRGEQRTAKISMIRP
jgi:flagellar hook assembly protein FlgD